MDGNLDQWIRDNKKSIAREFIRKTMLTSSSTPVGIITAGLPGTGKTEFTQELLKQTNSRPIRIDMDEIATLIEGYKPEIADKFRAGASAIMNRIYDEVIKNHIDFVLDGTFAGTPAISNVERAIDKDYIIKIYYIHQDPLVAWQFTQAREVIEHRSINKAGFIDTYVRIYENLQKLDTLKGKISVSVITKTKDNKVGKLQEDIGDILQAIPSPMTRIELEELLQ
jgi:UDP-N-acetylglucosamine kinase